MKLDLSNTKQYLCSGVRKHKSNQPHLMKDRT